VRSHQENTEKSWFLSFFRSAEPAEARISDELAEYGYYARSLKPKEGWLLQSKEISMPLIDLF
jgi:hypothetical protein